LTERDNDEYDNRKDQPVEDSFADENTKSGSRKKTDAFDLNEKVRLGKKNRNSNSILRSVSQIFGPGVITGASDDDPSGIATYSQAGAKFGLGIIWMSLFQLPMMIVVQEMCARIGLVTGKGLAGVIKSKYPKKILYPVASLLIIANTINIGADIGAMAAAARLIFPILPIIVSTISFTVLIIIPEILIPYKKYTRILKYLTLSLFAYVLTAIIVGGNWEQIFFASIIPHFEFNSDFATMFVAVLGTTISPYLFFWQASEEAEEDVAKNKIEGIGKGRPKITIKDIMLMKEDVAIGMFFSIFITWSIILTSAGSLHENGIMNIETADQAAEALEPLVHTFPNSGYIAKIIFALGIVGTGLLAIPVLAGASAYAISDTFGWSEGLGKKFRQAKQFYVVIIASTVIGLLINFIGINPIQALIYAAVINGVVAVPMLFIIMKIANDKKVLEGRTNGLFSNVAGWITFVVMGIAAVIMFLTWGPL
jgi:NRAMP (natural resistance-associated macrophage protein)-like metal ion transporter